jgi:hypothetical protein
MRERSFGIVMGQRRHFHGPDKTSLKSPLSKGGTIINGPDRVASSSTDGFSEVERNSFGRVILSSEFELQPGDGVVRTIGLMSF